VYSSETDICTTFQKKKIRDGRYETKDEKAALAYYDMMKDSKKEEEEDEDRYVDNLKIYSY